MASKPLELALLQLLADYGDRWQIQFDEGVSLLGLRSGADSHRDASAGQP
jgi:hypothetical protein